tara:strand:- start:21 stop:506 length:486 start_codon:yes stop_codon:yes gene_type:complete
MARTKHKQKASFAGIPRMVMECPDYINLSSNAIRLLVELSCSYKGGNNGDLCPAWTLMKERGFRSKATLTRVIKELVAAEMIILTRQGQFIRNRAGLYALTWASIDECAGKQLDESPTRTPPRNFSLERQQGWPRKLDPPEQKLNRKGTKTAPKPLLRAVN